MVRLTCVRPVPILYYSIRLRSCDHIHTLYSLALFAFTRTHRAHGWGIITASVANLLARRTGATGMPLQATFAPAAAYTLDALSDIFTRSFENYFYPGTTTAAILAARVRTEQIDLQHSLVMCVGDDPAGLALL